MSSKQENTTEDKEGKELVSAIDNILDWMEDNPDEDLDRMLKHNEVHVLTKQGFTKI